MKILLLGKNGQVGWELQRALQPLGQVIALGRQKENGLSGDLSNLQALDATIRSVQPDVVVNAAAYTAVDKAESEHEQAYLINARAPEVIANALKANKGLLVHYSTDYVFDGSGNEPRTESAPTSPVNYYGYSKLAGERLIANSGCAHLVFRTSWVYGAQGNNFAKTMMCLAQEKEELSIVGDQIGVPTGADLIADMTAHAIRSYMQGIPGRAREDQGGIYHLVPDGETSWFEYASLVFGQLGKKRVPLALKQTYSVATQQYPTPAKRPLNSRLCNQKIKDVFALHLPDWEPGVCRLLDEIVA